MQVIYESGAWHHSQENYTSQTDTSTASLQLPIPIKIKLILTNIRRQIGFTMDLKAKLSDSICTRTGGAAVGGVRAVGGDAP